MAEAQEWVAPKSAANPTTRAFFINPLPECYYSALLSSTSEPVHSKKIIFGGPFTTMAVLEQLVLAAALDRRRGSRKLDQPIAKTACWRQSVTKGRSIVIRKWSLGLKPPVQHKYQQASTGLDWVLWALTTWREWKFMSNTH